MTVDSCSAASNKPGVKDVFVLLLLIYCQFFQTENTLALASCQTATARQVSSLGVLYFMSNHVRKNHIGAKSVNQSPNYLNLTPSTLVVPNCCCSKCSAPYWSKPPFFIFDIRALWHSVLSARTPECQKLKMVG